MRTTGVDVARIRGLYPALAGRTAQLDGSFATLQPESVIRAVISTLRAAPAQPGSHSTRSIQSATRAAQAHRAVADLVAGEPRDVLLGGSTVALLLRFATLVSIDWQLGDEVVLNRLDADVALHPWLRMARGRGVVVRWAEVDLETGQLPAWQYRELIGRRTRIVTVPLGNPATGTVPDVRAIADLAHRHGALVVADAGVTPNYTSLDLEALGADVLAIGAPVFGGPTVAALVARPGLLEEIRLGVDRDSGDESGPGGFEVPPLPIELLAGLTAAVDHLAGLDEYATGTRRERLKSSLAAAEQHTRELYRRLDEGLRGVPGVTVLGSPQRTLPVAAFTVAGHRPGEVGAFLQRHDVSVWTGPAGVSELLQAFGADEFGGAVFVGLMPHTIPGEVTQLIDALHTLIR